MARKQRRRGSSPSAKTPRRGADAVPADASDQALPEAAPALAADMPVDAAPADATQADATQADAVEAAADVPVAEQVAPDATQADGVDAGQAAAQPAAQASPRAVEDPFAILLDYEQRSLAHVAGLPEQLDAPGLWRGIGYRIGQRRLASPFDEVVEVLPMPQVTPVPGAQPWMLGVANVRGNLLPTVDLKQFLEGERTVLHEGQRVLIVRQPGGDVAVTIDELYGQRSFVEAQRLDAIDGSSLVQGRYGHFVDRAYRAGEADWGVFSLDRLARTPEFRQAAA